MADEKRLIFRLEAQNADYLRKLEQSQKKINDFEKTAGSSIQSVTRKMQNLGGRPTQNIVKFGKAANDSARGASRAMGQLGFQVQDIAVQLHGGQNPLLILSQQGSQVASIFGPGGAVIGALLAVGAAIGSVLLPKLFETTDALKKMEVAFSSVEKIIEELEPGVITLTEKFDRLAKSSEILSASQIKIALQDISEALKDSNMQALELVKTLSPGELGGRIRRTSLLVGILKNKFIDGRIGLDEFNEGLNKLFIQAEAPTTAFKDVIKDISEIAEKSKKLRESQRTLMGGVGDISTKSETKALEAQQKKAVKFQNLQAELENKRIAGIQNSFFALEDSLRSEEQVINDSYLKRLDIINAFEMNFEGFEDEINEARINAKEEFNKKMDNLEKARMAALTNNIQGSLSIIANGLDKEKGLGKAAFIAQQAMAIPKMIVATEAAAAQALTLGSIAGPIASGAIRALGYSSIGIVAGQTIASFDGGGSTRPGARAGGLDGRGGQLAMLHPNEKVLDLNKQATNDEAWSVNVHNYGNAKVSQSIDEERKIVSIMVDQARNTSSPFQNAMRENTNIAPKGIR
jgi:hypothetical protein